MSIFNLRYFKIKRCGYYTRAQSGRNHYENIPATLEHLKQWAKNKTIEETGIECEENPNTSFLIDIEHQGDFWVLILWNKTDNGASNEIISIDMSSKFGQADSKILTSKGKTVFGYASYILVCPEKRFYATITPDHSLCSGREQFDAYIKAFLDIDPEYAEYDHTSDLFSNDNSILERTKIGFNLPVLLDGTPQPRFNSEVKRSQSEKALIIKNFNRISQIKTTYFMRVSKQQYKSFLQKISSQLFGNTDLFTPTETIKINSTISTSFSQQSDLIEWIEDWEATSARTDDCGFKLLGDEKTYWLRGNIIRTPVELPTLKRKNGIYPASEILSMISNHKDRIFNDFNITR